MDHSNAGLAQEGVGWMTVLAGAELRQLVTRNILNVVSEGVPRLVLPDRESQAAFGDGCLTLSCRGSEMTATVRVERHTGEPGAPGSPWQPAARGQWHLTSGRLGVGNIEGLLDWLPDLDLHAGVWNVLVSTSYGEAASELEEHIMDEEPTDVTDGPEQFLVQLWP